MILSNILKDLKLTYDVDVSRLPISKLDNSFIPVSIPLYGELLMVEVKFYEALNDAVSSLTNKFSKLFDILGYTPTELEAFNNLYREIQLGLVSCVKLETVVDTDWSAIGQVELLEFLETVPGDSKVIRQAHLEALIPVITTYYEDWVELKTNCTSVAELVNLVLNGGSYQKRVVVEKEVNGEDLLTAAGLTWVDLYNYSEIKNPLTPISVLLALRTGDFNSDLIGLFTPNDLKTISNEFGIIPEETVVANKNVTLAEGDGNAPLEPGQKKLKTTRKSQKLKE